MGQAGGSSNTPKTSVKPAEADLQKRTGLGRSVKRGLWHTACAVGVGAAGYTAYRAATRPRSNARGRIVIVGGGTAGLDIAARLRRSLSQAEIIVIEPERIHYYQPGFTLIACGEFQPGDVGRPEAALIPLGVSWLQDRVVSFEPERNRLETASHGTVEYDFMVLASGCDMHFEQIEGITRDRLGEGNVHSIYDFQSARKCWKAIRELAVTGGRAYFTDAWTAIKCGGAPKKINLLAEDYCRRQDSWRKVDFQFYSAAPAMFDVPLFRERLEEIFAGRGITTNLRHRIKSVDTEARRVMFERTVESGNGTELQTDTVTREYDFLHIVPPMSPPACVLDSSLMDDPATGARSPWVPTDPSTLRHARFENVFVAGDVAGIPTAKTAAGIQKQAPVVAQNLLAAMEGLPPQAVYNGYAACPFITEYGKVLMAEFDYEKKPVPTMPLLDPTKEHRYGWMLVRYALKPFYFDVMLRGRA
ncbi:MAG: NAD(P)/FAD-dependent oxidoreductase [Bryobacterales bacterium]|nr:NAD(P)/FAD-dependent oxidoreductase [Bryobacterales bacterium]